MRRILSLQASVTPVDLAEVGFKLLENFLVCVEVYLPRLVVVDLPLGPLRLLLLKEAVDLALQLLY